LHGAEAEEVLAGAELADDDVGRPAVRERLEEVAPGLAEVRVGLARHHRECSNCSDCEEHARAKGCSHSSRHGSTRDPEASGSRVARGWGPCLRKSHLWRGSAHFRESGTMVESALSVAIDGCEHDRTVVPDGDSSP